MNGGKVALAVGAAVAVGGAALVVTRLPSRVSHQAPHPGTDIPQPDPGLQPSPSNDACGRDHARSDGP